MCNFHFPPPPLSPNAYLILFFSSSVEVIKLGLTLDAGHIMQFYIETNADDGTKRNFL